LTTDGRAASLRHHPAPEQDLAHADDRAVKIGESRL
jgi:hypothetical protein